MLERRVGYAGEIDEEYNCYHYIIDVSKTTDRWLAREEGVRISGGEIAHEHRKCHHLSKFNETSRLVHMNRRTTMILRKLA